MTTILEKGNISIHTENIFPIIKKWLYSDHEIFLRELVSNAVDAIQKLKMVSHSGEFSGELGEAEIVITIDKAAKTLSVSDTGIGMTGDEVKKYINQVAFSSAEEFVEKYKASTDQQIIGHFGLGFYSSFMVAAQVEIDTLSYRAGAQAIHWSCDGSTEFELSDSSRTSRGTTVTLHLQDEEQEYLEAYRIRQLIKTYCDFLPVPIKLEVKETPKEGEESKETEEPKAPEQINRQKAPWKESPSSLSKEDYLEFYRYLYPFQEEPLLWVHLNTDYPFVVNGILYFPKLKPDVDTSKGQIKLFCNQVFVSDNCEEVIPKFLLPLRGVVDSIDIPLNVSRSFLQNDRTVRRIADYIAKKVGDRLKELYRDDRAEYVRCWQDLGTFVKFGSINDDKFKKQVEDILIYRTTWQGVSEESGATTEAKSESPKVEVQSTEGDAWQDVTPQASESSPLASGSSPSYTTLKEYLERNKERHTNRVFYCTDEVSQATYVELHKQQGLEVLFLDSFIDTHFVSFLEREHPDVKFARVDADLDETLLDKNKDTEIVDPKTNKTRSEQIKDLFQQALNKPKLTIRTEALKSHDEAMPPAIVLLPEHLRRMQEMNAFLQQQAVQFPEEHILLVNTAHPLIQNLTSLSQGVILQGEGQSPSAELANLICHHVYDLALMAQKGFDADGMKTFVERSNQVLTRLTERATS
ncbi:molecular chaperone HtpG [Leptolyngbya sp. FACHB-36]|uniref:molecular chaperone HtpG n=1 Tax=Leptolyngbya sp. FACHB-36 TaxID=2692808 RepID=UPI00168153E5|nr:molecular chaperone HtpG [Leptolyngbya sp. FACHB-36]MBD2020037.1 molecular chaperone HtpG [Leptolyngbya sp. FACHB-36]